ncbi:hypothetical protein QYS49_32965 [Marivirga salinae]|uniref:Outer membrane protein beta-barrel domain-containing protein n=1 Tax=Marivirga salinarum TaxID=3059078 RepID=A0AA51NE24_9BACT|nr:hypothetical protein [Marivirga sp. BDSF4-3]WMN12250.1 hypothetical protein QYS49_32965 [Marivirga sp. BDSF4-3]
MTKKITISVLLLIFTITISYSQSRDKKLGLRYSSDYALFQGEGKFVYNPTVGHKLGLIKENGSLTLGGELGYFNFSPKEEEFYYLTSNTTYGTAKYSDYKILSLNLIFLWNLQVNRNFQIKPGVHSGYYFVMYETSISDDFVNSTESFISGRGGITPTIEFHYALNENWSIDAHSMYHIFFEIGNSDPSSVNFNSSLGIAHRVWSNGLGITYFF